MDNNGSQNTERKEPSYSQAKAAKPFVSKGWWIHNEITYRAVNWILNSTIGVAFAYCAEATAMGRKWWSEPVTHFYKKALGYIKNEENFKAVGAKWGSRFTNIMVGGFTIIPFVMYMENKKHKKKIVHWIDEKIYGKDFVNNDPKFEQSYQNIDKEPEKKFGVGMLTRFIALAPLLIPVFAPKPRKWLDENIFNNMAKGTEWAVEKIKIKPTASMRATLVPEDTYGRNQWQFLHYLIAFDFGLTFIYSFLHEAAYKALAAFGVKPTKPSDVPKDIAPNPPMKKDREEPVPENAVAGTLARKYATKPHNGYETMVESRAANMQPVSL